MMHILLGNRRYSSWSRPEPAMTSASALAHGLGEGAAGGAASAALPSNAVPTDGKEP